MYRGMWQLSWMGTDGGQAGEGNLRYGGCYPDEGGDRIVERFRCGGGIGL